MPPWGGCFDIAGLKKEIGVLESEMEKSDFWSNQEKATRKSQRTAALSKEVSEWEKLDRNISDLVEISKIAENEGGDMDEEIQKKFDEIQKDYERIEFRLLFSGKYDEFNVILSVHSGAGGTEAQDWAEMLLRMFLRFAESKEFKVEILHESRADFGIKSATVRIAGRYAYGYFRSEHGVHRLVRISPFDAEKMRHTSFALVEVMPEFEDVAEVVIDPKDLRVDTFLSGGHGGQSVQTTYSAVRVVHIPTGIAVSCQNERSQLQNKETALKILKSKLYQKAVEEREEKERKLRGEPVKAEWGSQIRSYVLHPYKLVKDHRNDFEVQDAENVLNGNLEDFVEAYLRWRAVK